MIRVESDRLVIDGPVTIETAADLSEAVLAHGNADIKICDWSNVPQVDSAALALIFAIQRARPGTPIEHLNLPESLNSLAATYGVADLIAH